MPRFCEHCGAPLKDDARFCTGCGHPVAVKSQPAQPSQQRQQPQQPQQGQAYGQPPQSQSRPQQHYSPQQGNQVKFQPSAQAYTPQPPKKKGGGVKALLIVALIAVLGYGGWEYYQYRDAKGKNSAVAKENPKQKQKRQAQKPQESGVSQGAESTTLKALETKKGSVSADSPSVTLCGVTVEVAPEMLKSGSQTVTVSRLGSSTDEDGVRSERYELEMGKHRKFDEPVRVTFPCSVPANTDVVVSHYDAEEEEWMPLLSFVDEASGTVSAHFGSFSPAKVSYLPVGKNPKIYVIRRPYSNEPYVMRFEVASNYMDIMKRINPSLYSGEVKKFSADPQNYSVPMPALEKGMGTNAAYEAFKEASQMWTFCDPLINLGMESLPPSSQQRAVQFLIDNTDKVGKFMNAVPFVVMGTQVCFDLHEASKNLSDKDALKTPAVNLYKNLFSSSGTIYSLAANYSHIGFSLAFFGVAIIGMEIDAFVDAAKAAKVENVEDVFNAYYTKTQPIDGHHWYMVFKEAYWKNDGNIKKAMKDLKEAVDDYCGKFWRDVYDSNSDDFWFAIGDSKYRKVFEDATSQQKQALTEQQKRKVWQLIEYESMEEIEDFLMVRMQEKIYKQLYKNPLLKEYNKDLSFTIQEDLGDESGQAQYAGRTICLGSGGKPFKDWYYNVPEDALDIGWDTKFIPCTYLGYIKMGMPDQVLVYPSEDALLAGDEPMEAIDFEPDLKKGYTVVELHKGKPTSDNYKGDRITHNLQNDDFMPCVEAAIPNLRIILSENGDFEATAKGAYSGPLNGMVAAGVSKIIATSESAVTIKGNIDKSTGKGTFSMHSDMKQTSITYYMKNGETMPAGVPEVHPSLDVTGDITLKTESDKTVTILLSGRGKITNAMGQSFDIGKVDIYFKPVK